MQSSSAVDVSATVFLKRQRNQTVIRVLLTALIGVSIFRGKIAGLLDVSKSDILTGAVLIMSALMVYTLFNWRCPSCNRYLGRNLYIKVCKGCGKVFPAARDTEDD